jgi:hypothetical protein
MSKVKMSVLSELRDDQAAAYANRVIGLMTNDPQFVSAAADIAELKTRCEAYEKAYQENEIGGRPATIIKNECKAALIEQLKRVGLLVNYIANGSELVILAAGFDISKNAQNYTELTAPLLKVVRDERAKGVVTLKFGKVEGANNYGIKKRIVGADMPNMEWQNGEFSTASNLRIEGLESDKYYEFVVYAVGSKGLVSPNSNIEKVMVS